MKENIVYDFFNPSESINSLIKHFGLDENSVKNYLENYKYTDNFTSRQIDFIKTFGLDLPNIDSRNIKIKCKHLTTSFDKLESIKRYGLLPLNRVLQFDTILNRFLKENDIVINVDEKKMNYKNQVIDLHGLDEDCKDCINEKCKYERKDYFNKIDIRYKNTMCQHRENLKFLNKKLFNDKSELEVHISGTIEEIINYSCISTCPEILDTINNTIKSVFKENNSLCEKWRDKKNREVYIAEFTLNLEKFEYLTNGRYFSRPYEFQRYSDACGYKIEWSDIEWENLNLNQKIVNFFSNIFLLVSTLESYWKSSFRSYAQLLPNIGVSEDHIIFTKIF